MNQRLETVRTFYVGQDNKVLITCPACEYSKLLNLSPETIKKMKMALNRFKCKCGKVFSVQIEFRNSYRKKVHLPGTCQNPENRFRIDIIVEDLSLGGIRFTVMDPAGISPGDQVEVSLRLDNANRTMVRRTANVRWVNGRMVGAEWNSFHGYEKDLGFYLLK